MLKKRITKTYHIQTLFKNGYQIRLYARPWLFRASKEVYAAIISTPNGYLKGSVSWSANLATTVHDASMIAYSLPHFQ